jgi:hypothetical protein
VSIVVRTPDVLEEVDGGVGRDVGRVKGKLLELGRVDVAADGCEKAARRSNLRNSMRLEREASLRTGEGNHLRL